MSQGSKYFVIPFEDVPASPSYPVWYATWSTVRPTLEPGASAPLVVGATMDQLPPGAILLGSGDKDPPTPPPPPLPEAVSVSEYQRSIETWLALGRDA